MTQPGTGTRNYEKVDGFSHQVVSRRLYNLLGVDLV